MRLALLFILLLQANHILSQNEDPRSYEEKQRSGDYYPFIKLSKSDKIKWPSKYDYSIYISELYDVNTKNDFFYVKFNATVFALQDTIYDTSEGYEITLSPLEEISFDAPEGDRQYGEYKVMSKVPYENDSVYAWSFYWEGELPHKWNLRDFPFDKQELKISFSTRYDTSLVRVSNSIIKPPVINIDDIDFLIDGYDIEGLKFENSYQESINLLDFPDSKRRSVVETLTYKIIIERNGSFLFFKLFFGAFLSYIVSLLVFFIDKRYFETRITLILGAIFGAVGNKYFVESNIPEYLILTKADIINNIVILFIVINIFLVIGQASNKINLRYLEKNNNSLYVSLSLFIISNFIIYNI